MSEPGKSGGRRIRGVLRALWYGPPGAPRRRSRLTREGKAYVFVTLGVGLAAFNTGHNLLYLMLGLMLSLLLLSMVLSENALRSVRVARRLPSRAFARTPCLVELRVENGKRFLPSYSLDVEDVAETDPTDRRCYFLKVAPEDAQTAAYRRTPARRGLLRLKGERVVTRYPFGLVEKIRTYTDEATLLVYPALVPVDPTMLRGLRHGAESPSGRVGPGTEIAGLRDYVPGDEARTIQWRRTASLGRLVVREHERDASARVTLALDNARPAISDDAWNDAFERAVSEVASLAAAALARGSAVDVVTRSGTTPIVLPGSPVDPIWSFLALLDPVDARTAPPLAAPRDRAVVDVRVRVAS